MDELKKYGWISLKLSFDAPISPTKEIIYFIKRFIVDLLALPFLLFFVLIIFFVKKKLSKNRVLLGTHPIVTNTFLREIIKSEFDTELFVFKNWSPDHHNGITLADIAPSWLPMKEPYLFGSYYAFFWALKNFEIFVFYFDSGFLERTFWWKLEPIFYRLLGKKILMHPYGGDVWNSLLNHDLKRKFGHLRTYERYFNLDFKRIKRTYWWSKYANIIIGPANYIYWLPRVDFVVWHGHMKPNIERKEFIYPDIKPKVKIIHYANDAYRKGSHLIKNTFSKLEQQRDDFEFFVAERLHRDEALRLLDESHIYIDNLIDGLFSFSSLEAMAKGKVVVTNLDGNIDELYTYLNPDYYMAFFEEMPIVRANAENIKSVIIELLDNKERLAELGKRSLEFAHKIFSENEMVWKMIFAKLRDS